MNLRLLTRRDGARFGGCREALIMRDDWRYWGRREILIRGALIYVHIPLSVTLDLLSAVGSSRSSAESEVTQMTQLRSIVLAAPVRTAIGTFGGSLKDMPAPDLGAVALGAAVERAGLRPEEIGTVVMGNVI
jgi:Thiolase, N-terminal domain